jgi:hypothetical protein
VIERWAQVPCRRVGSSPRDCEIENGGFITITLGRAVPESSALILAPSCRVTGEPGNRPSRIPRAWFEFVEQGAWRHARAK